MIAALYLEGRAWSAAFAGSGAAGETHADAEGWPGLYTPAARWLCAVYALHREAQMRGLSLTAVECCGMPEPLRRMVASGRVEWPADLAAWRDAVKGTGLRLTAAPIRRRDRARVAQLVAGAPAADAVLTGVAGLGAVGLTALAAA